MFNQNGGADARRLLTGKDGMLFNESGKLLATIESFQTQVNVTNATYQPLGDAQSHEVFQSYSVSLTASECIIEDNDFIKDLVRMMQSGQPVRWTFQGKLKGRTNGLGSDSNQQTFIYRDCVPTGNIDLQNMQVGDLIKRAWSFTVNKPPELQSLLSASDGDGSKYTFK